MHSGSTFDCLGSPSGRRCTTLKSPDGSALANSVGYYQVTLCFVGADIFPIPGSKNPSRVRENAKAASIKLTAEVLTPDALLNFLSQKMCVKNLCARQDLRTIEEAVTEFEGDRYPGYAMGMCHEKRSAAQSTATQGA